MEENMPIWVTILISLASGIIATIVTLFVQHISEKKRIKKELLLSLASFRDCTIDDSSLKECINKVQIVFYKDKDVIKKYYAFIEKNITTPCEKNQSILSDEFIALIESIARVTGFKKFNWQNIKKKYSLPDYHNDEIEESKPRAVRSDGVSKKKKAQSNSKTIQREEKM